MKTLLISITLACALVVGCDVQEPQPPPDLPPEDPGLWEPCKGEGLPGVCEPWEGHTVICLTHVGPPSTSICAPFNWELGENCEDAPAPLAGAADPLPYGGECASKCTDEADCPSGMLCSTPWIGESGACGWPVLF